MIELAFCVAGFFVVLILVLEMIGKVDYRVGRMFLEVRLFGVRLRRIPLADIVRISKRRRGFCEMWPNTLRPRKRLLILTRKSGWIRYFLITPEHRYVFKQRLKQAISTAKGASAPEVIDEDMREGESDDEEEFDEVEDGLNEPGERT